MKTFRRKNEKIVYWLILVFSWSGLSVQENMGLDFQGQGQQESQGILLEKNTSLAQHYQMDLLGACDEKASYLKYSQGPVLGYTTRQNKSWLARPQDLLFHVKNTGVILVLRKISPPTYLVSATINPQNRQARYKTLQSPQSEKLFKKPPISSHASIQGKGILLLLAAGSIKYLYNQFYKKMKQSKRARKTIDQQAAISPSPKPTKSQQIPNSNTLNKPRTGPPEHVIADILQGLKRFEREQWYLDKKLDLTKLADKLETKRRYLSHVINKHKKMPYPDYIKKLRITYAKEHLLKNPSLYKYDLVALAPQFGFKTSRSFSEAFSKLSGQLTAEFLAELKEKSKSENYPSDNS